MLGAEMGPESSWIDPATDNPLGFFEYRPVVDVNRGIIAALSGTWSSPPAFPPGWIEDDRIVEQREQARQLAGRLPTWMVVKDPRLSLVQDLWDSVCVPQPCLLCLRHPSAVAESLHDRNRLTIEQGLHLWFRYTSRAIINRPDALVIEYEHLIRDPESELRRAAGHIGLEVTSATLAAAAGSVRADMAHHDGAQLSSSPVGEICGALYRVVRTGGVLTDHEAVSTWARLATESPWASAADGDLARIHAAARAAELAADNLRHRLDEVGKRVRRLESELRVALAAMDNAVISTTAQAFTHTENPRRE